MNRSIILLFLAALICIASNCKKNEKIPTYYMTQDFKDYVVFPIGSYWVYEDSISNAVVDSLYLFNFHIRMQKNSKLKCIVEEMIQYFYSSQNSNVTAFTFRSDEYYEYYGNGYYFDITINPTIGFTGASGQYYANFDSLKILDVWYKDVICIKKYGVCELYNYWVKHIGIVKIENRTNNTVLKLKNYHINH